MHVTVNGTRLWFDVDGPARVPDGQSMSDRPTVVLVHGGPGSYDHSYFKPDFAHLANAAQVVYLDLRGHGLSEWGRPEDWSYEVCADDLRAFTDALGIGKPVLLGHSMGGWVVAIYGARHPGHAGGLVLQGTMARFDLERLVDGFRRAGGNDSPRSRGGTSGALRSTPTSGCAATPPSDRTFPTRPSSRGGSTTRKSVYAEWS